MYALQMRFACTFDISNWVGAVHAEMMPAWASKGLLCWIGVNSLPRDGEGDGGEGGGGGSLHADIAHCHEIMTAICLDPGSMQTTFSEAIIEQQLLELLTHPHRP